MTSPDPTKVNLIIINNLMHEMNEVVTKLVSKGSHHRNTRVLLLTQNIFHQNKHSRTVYQKRSDASQITHLAKQIYPGDVKYLKSSYEDATNKHYGCGLIYSPAKYTTFTIK